MKFTIAQIGANRLQRVLVTNKKENPKAMAEVLKSDFKNVLESYLDDFEVDINIQQYEEGVEINVDVRAKRVKSFGTLPC